MKKERGRYDFGSASKQNTGSHNRKVRQQALAGLGEIAGQAARRAWITKHNTNTNCDSLLLSCEAADQIHLGLAVG
jgi:hypothetical protein